MRHYSIKKKEGKNAHSTISGKHSIFNFLVIANAGKTIRCNQRGKREREKVKKESGIMSKRIDIREGNDQLNQTLWIIYILQK